METGTTIVAGETSTHAAVDIEKIIRDIIKEISYDHSRLGFDGNTCYVLSTLGRQSANIADGTHSHSIEKLGVGGQSITFSYACDETSELTPAMLIYTHRLMEHQAQLHKSQRLPFLLPGAKSQVTLRYQDSRIYSADAVMVSTQHSPDVSLGALQEVIIGEIVKPVTPSHWLTLQTRFLVNPISSFMIDGPAGDCRLTRRKIVVDIYGGAAYHGDGALSSKGPSRVDHSATYVVYHVAKNIVTARLALYCEVQLGWAAGLSRPVPVRINALGVQTVLSEVLLRGVSSHSDLSMFGIITTLDLLVPHYCKTAYYGHFGRDSFPWEVTDKTALLHEDVGC